jgi:hypothetical protein
LGGSIFNVDLSEDGRPGYVIGVAASKYSDDFSEPDKKPPVVQQVNGIMRHSPGFSPIAESPEEIFKLQLITILLREAHLPTGGTEDAKTIDGIEHVNDGNYNLEIEAGADLFDLLDVDRAADFSNLG